MLSPKLLDRHPSQAVWTITYKSTCVRFLSFGFSQNVYLELFYFLWCSLERFLCFGWENVLALLCSLNPKKAQFVKCYCLDALLYLWPAYVDTAWHQTCTLRGVSETSDKTTDTYCVISLKTDIWHLQVAWEFSRFFEFLPAPLYYKRA